MGRMQACLVEVFERILTALVPCVLAFFLFNELTTVRLNQVMPSRNPVLMRFAA